MTADNELLKTLEDNPGLREKVNEQLMSRDCGAFDRIYVDLVLMKDTRMGLMLALANETHDTKMVDYLRTDLKKYNSRPNRSFTIAYPNLKYSEEKLQDMYQHPRFSRMAFEYAPDTVMHNSLISEFTPYFDQNDRAGYKNKVVLIINTYPLHLETIKDLIDIYGKMLTRIIGNRIEVRFISQDPLTISPVTFISFKAIYIDDITKLFCEGGVLCDAFCKRQCLLHRVISPILVEDPVLQIWKDQGLDIFDTHVLLERVQLTSCALNMGCIFDYRPFNIPLPKDK